MREISLYQAKKFFFKAFENREKKGYFISLNGKDISNYKILWHAVKPFLSSKIKWRESNILVEKDKIIFKEGEVANSLNGFF